MVVVIDYCSLKRLTKTILIIQNHQPLLGGTPAASHFITASFLMSQIPLLTPYQMGDLDLLNRVVMAPMTRNRSKEGLANDLNEEYYTQRASAGLLVTEAIPISEQAIGAPWVPGLFTETQAESWAKVVKAVHQKGGRIVAQLWHTGRVSHPYYLRGELPVGPSAIKAEGRVFTPEGLKEYVTPRALAVSEIKQIVDDYRRAAQFALQAGFDGIELHAAFGYLPNQFLSDASNQRTDEYGGTVENRSRFVLEVMRAFCTVWPSRRVGIRIAPSNVYNSVLDSNPPLIYDYLVKQLNSLQLAYLSLMNPFVKEHTNPHFISDVTGHFRNIYEGTLITNVNYTRESGNEAISQGKADLVAYGSLYVANPDLVERFAANAPLNMPDKTKYYGGDAQGYTDYPFWQEALVS